MHTFLSLDMNLIPQWTKDNVPTFYSGRFSNDNSRMLLDGKNSNSELVHAQFILNAWLGGELDKTLTLNTILDNAIEYTRDEFIALTLDINSIWYVQPEEV